MPPKPGRRRSAPRREVPRQAAFVERLFRDLGGLRRWLRRLPEDCEYAFFADAWRRVQVSLADARHKADLAGRRGRYIEHRLDLSATARLGADYVEAVLR